MTDDLPTPEYLESLAAAISRLGSRMDSLERGSLEALLTGGGASRIAAMGLPDMQVGRDQAAFSMGNVLSSIGQTNLLDDPTFETYDTTTISTTPSATGGWVTYKVLESGTVGDGHALRIYERASDGNPWSSAALRLLLTQPTGSGTTTFYIEPELPFEPGPTPYAPYLVAAVRVGALDAAGIYTNLSTITCALEILDTSGAIVAESADLDFTTVITAQPDQRQIVAALTETAAVFATETYLWRIRVRVTTSGPGSEIRVYVGEPQLHFSFSPDPLPFAPNLGSWRANSLRASKGSPNNSPITVRRNDDDADRFSIDWDGTLRWTDGTIGGDGVSLGRSGDQLTLDSNLASYGGLASFTPTVTNGGTATFTTQEGRWNRVGSLIFVWINLVVNAAGSGGSLVTVALPVVSAGLGGVNTFPDQFLPVSTSGAGTLGPAVAVIGSDDDEIAFIRLRDGSTLTGAGLTSLMNIRIQGVYHAQLV